MEKPVDEPPKVLLAITDFIDLWIGRLSGLIACWMIIPMAFGLFYEVFARYLFRAPTNWAYEITYQLYGAHFMLGAAYTLLVGKHIRTDLVYEKFSVKWQGRVDFACYIIFFFPGIFFFFLAGWDEALHAWEIGELSEATPWRPPLYYFKTSIPVALFLLLIQGVSETLKSGYAAIRGRRI